MFAISQKINLRGTIGLLLFVGSVQFILSILIAEGIALNYSSAVHYVSTLGVGNTALIFNSSVLILGLCVILCSYILQREYQESLSTLLLLLTGICTAGVGLFPENSRPFHGIFTAFTFVFAALFLISVIKIERSPIPIFISIGGLILLILLFIFFPYLGLEVDSTVKFLGLMKGTLERFIIYLTVSCFLVFGGYFGKKSQ
ncbi:DUF998 domain-containing protein [Candidatus Hodarchaeum mangrovi]